MHCPCPNCTWTRVVTYEYLYLEIMRKLMLQENWLQNKAKQRSWEGSKKIYLVGYMLQFIVFVTLATKPSSLRLIWMHSSSTSQAVFSFTMMWIWWLWKEVSMRILCVPCHICTVDMVIKAHDGIYIIPSLYTCISHIHNLDLHINYCIAFVYQARSCLLSGHPYLVVTQT